MSIFFSYILLYEWHFTLMFCNVLHFQYVSSVRGNSRGEKGLDNLTWGYESEAAGGHGIWGRKPHTLSDGSYRCLWSNPQVVEENLQFWGQNIALLYISWSIFDYFITKLLLSYGINWLPLTFCWMICVHKIHSALNTCINVAIWRQVLTALHFVSVIFSRIRK